MTKNFNIIKGTGKVYQSRRNGSTAAQMEVNVVDCIGFCDSTLEPQKVVELIQTYVKDQNTPIDKVIVVVSSRLEVSHLAAQAGVRGGEGW